MNPHKLHSAFGHRDSCLSYTILLYIPCVSINERVIELAKTVTTGLDMRFQSIFRHGYRFPCNRFGSCKWVPPSTKYVVHRVESGRCLTVVVPTVVCSSPGVEALCTDAILWGISVSVLSWGGARENSPFRCLLDKWEFGTFVCSLIRYTEMVSKVLDAEIAGNSREEIWYETYVSISCSVDIANWTRRRSG